MQLIPASAVENPDGPVFLAMADIDRAASYAGVEAPEDLDDMGVDYIRYLTGAQTEEDVVPQVHVLLPVMFTRGQAFQQQEFHDEMGWSLRDVDWFVEQALPPGVFTVLAGDFDEDRLAGALDGQGEYHDGIWRIGEDDFGVQVGELTVARPVGESLRLAQDDDRLMVARAFPPVEDALDGDGETLYDDPTLRALAAGLDDEDVYSAHLEVRSFALGESGADGRPVTAEQVEAMADHVLPEPFQGLAVGLAYEDDAAVAVLVYSHRDEDAAEANAAAFDDLVAAGVSSRTSQPHTESFSVDGVRVDGSTVVARLNVVDGRFPQLAYDLLHTRDPLVTHR